MCVSACSTNSRGVVYNYSYYTRVCGAAAHYLILKKAARQRVGVLNCGGEAANGTDAAELSPTSTTTTRFKRYSNNAGKRVRSMHQEEQVASRSHLLVQVLQ